MPQYVPRVSAERVEQLRRWHEDVSSELHARPTADIEYLGLQLRVPQGVFAPTPTSDLLGNLVTDHATPGLRVLDMGCGAGANAVLAARTGATVLGVDVNPAAVEASRANAARNGVADRTEFAVSDLFDAVEGDFDLVVIDPPFRWFSPRTMLERAFTDENYATLTAFLRDVPGRLRPSPNAGSDIGRTRVEWRLAASPSRSRPAVVVERQDLPSSVRYGPLGSVGTIYELPNGRRCVVTFANRGSDAFSSRSGTIVGSCGLVTCCETTSSRPTSTTGSANGCLRNFCDRWAS
jgi:release factor glutamine methyltransferase